MYNALICNMLQEQNATMSGLHTHDNLPADHSHHFVKDLHGGNKKQRKRSNKSKSYKTRWSNQ